MHEDGPEVKNRSPAFYVQLLLTLLLCAFLILPVIQSILAGLTVNYLIGLRSGLTVQWFRKVWDLYRDSIFRSIGIGLGCLGCTLLLGMPAAYVMAKKQNRITRLFEELLVTPLAVPGLAIALGLLISYGGFSWFRMSWLFILTGHVIFTLPFMVRSVIAILNSIDLQHFEEGAASLGAGFWNRFFHIALPNARPGILAGSLMVFTLSIGEFNLTWMLHTPMTKTLPVGLADSYASMRLEIGSAYTIAFFLMIIPLLLAMQWVATPYARAVPPKRLDMEIDLAALSLRETRMSDSTGNQEHKGNSARSGAALRLVQCAKTFPDGTRALQPVDLTVEAGETVVLLGPSGCGKTTLLRIIAGLESPDPGGKVFFGDEDVTATPIEKRNVGMVFQSYALFPNMNVAENIAYGLRVHRIDKDERVQRVNEMLIMMKISPLRNRRIDQLSGGQRQRVALARAIAVRPRLLLLDEPLTALDAKLRDALRVEIDTLLRSLGITAVYVTHDQAEAMALGDRMVVMDIGRVAQIGTPREVYYFPRSRFVADFVGTINRLRLRVARGRLTGPTGAIPLAEAVHIRAHEGEEIEVFFRPEQAEVVPAPEGHLQAVVESSFFMGDHTRLLLDWADGEYVTVEVRGSIAFQKGQTVAIRVDPAALLTLDG